MNKIKKSESRTEHYSRKQLDRLGWDLKKDVMEKQEIREKYPGYKKIPDFTLSIQGKPRVVIECKSDYKDIKKASEEAKNYAKDLNIPVAIGVAGNDEDVGILVESWYQGKRVSYKGCPLTQFLTKKIIEDLLQVDSNELDHLVVPDEKFFYDEAEYISNQFRAAHVDKKDMSRYLGCFILGLFYEKDIVLAMSDKGHRDVINSLLDKLDKQIGGNLHNQLIANVLKIHNPNDAVINHLMIAFPKIISSLRRLNIEALMRAGEDVIGLFFENFLRYSNDKKELGIVFTPRHIVRFMCDVIGLEIGDKVLDPCCGTGGFLVQAYSQIRKKIEEDYKDDPYARDRKTKELASSIYGIESESTGEILALAVVNMVIRGDGKSNIIGGDCFEDHTSIKDASFDKVLLNPPYSLKKRGTNGKSEEEFMDCALSKLQKGGMLCAIIPYSVLSSGKWYKQLTTKHSVVAAFSVPVELFYPVSMPTIIVLIKAGIPQKDSLTFMGRIDDDGYEIDRNKRSKKGKGDIEMILETFKIWQASSKKANLPKFYGVVKADDEIVPENYLLSEKLTSAVVSSKVDKVIREQLCFQIRYSDKVRDLDYEINDSKISNFMNSPLRLEDKRKEEIQDWRDIFFSRGEMLEKYTSRKNIKSEEYDLACMYGDKELHDKSWLQLGDDIIVSSGGTDNGLYGFYEYSHKASSLSQIYKENAMITCASAGTIGSAFVQEINFSACDSTLIFFPKPKVAIELLYYIAALLRLEAWRFRYGRQMTPARITKCLRLDLRYYDRIAIQKYRNQLPYHFNRER